MTADLFEMVPATIAHAIELAPRMREADVQECLASAGLAAFPALERSLEASGPHAWAALAPDGEVAFILGVAPGAPGIGAAWMLTSDLVEKHPKRFWRTCLVAVRDMQRIYPCLVNWVDCRNYRALRWAQRLGFEVSLPEPFGVEQRPFCRITLGRPHHV